MDGLMDGRRMDEMGWDGRMDGMDGWDGWETDVRNGIMGVGMVDG
jgi:hypothetical protein